MGEANTTGKYFSWPGLRLIAGPLSAMLIALVASLTISGEVRASPTDRAAMLAAPALIVEGGLRCTLTDARVVGFGTAMDKAPVTIYELACKEGLGFVIAKESTAGAPLLTYDCLMMATPQAGGKPTACTLPGNANPSSGLQAYVSQTGRECTVDKARFVGPTTGNNIYEVACQGGQGLILTVPTAVGAAPKAATCLAYSQPGSIECELTTADQQMASVDAVAVSSGKCAAVQAKRYVLSTADGSDYFEVACGDGQGYMLQVDHTGRLVEAIDCTKASGIGGGCTLTDVRLIETQQNALYSALARQAGFDCAVSKHALFPGANATNQVVELACSNRPDGVVGVFPASGAPRAYDCLRSQDEGYKCTLTPVEAVYSHLTDQLRTQSKSVCNVSGARPMGHGADGSDYVEVACADGYPGWVLTYTSGPEPTAVRGCAKAASIGDGCQLAANRGRK
jgi:hypothetical protein